MTDLADLTPELSGLNFDWLANGGFGEIYVANHPNLGAVAVKIWRFSGTGQAIRGLRQVRRRAPAAHATQRLF